MTTFNKGQFDLSKHINDQDFELLTVALNSSISGIIITDNRLPDNPIVYCNSAFEVISGYSRNEIIGHNCRFLQGEDRNQSGLNIIKEAITSGNPCTVEVRNYKKNGELFWNELYMSPIKNSNQEVTHFIGVQNDITKRKMIEHDLRHQKSLIEKLVEERTVALNESRYFLASIIETVREGLIVLSSDFIVLSANRHFLNTFKVGLEDTIGKNLYELGNNQWNIPKLRKLLTTILPTNNPVIDFEVEHDFPYIGKKTMLLNAYRIEYEGKFKDQILLAIEDITERKEIERRKDDFLSIASHELKTPLTTIKGYMQMLTKNIPENCSEKFVETVEKTSYFINRLHLLIEELLDVSKIQTGNLELHRVMFDFDKMVKDTIAGIQGSTFSHNIILKGETNEIILADESHIIQVLNNLLSNAIKYSPDSKVIEVHISNVSNFIKLSVRDYGVGVKASDKKRVFERFFRGSGVQKQYPGMGIGLYICDQIIKNHQGTLWVESEESIGSTFSFTLPKNRISK